MMVFPGGRGRRGRDGWKGRVAFSPDGGFAFKPGDILVPEHRRGRAREILRAYYREKGLLPSNSPARSKTGTGLGSALRGGRSVGGGFWRFTGLEDVLGAIGALRIAGIQAQVNHVLFATCCCPPHPGNPRANPFYANPFYANPFYANPFYANGGGGCGCAEGGASANPFYANPFYANPFYANPFYANGNPMGWDAETQATGRRRSSARPAPAPRELPVVPPGTPRIRVLVMDTGYADAPFALGLLNQHIHGDRSDVPDRSPLDGYLDPVAGHGTFIAGVIRRHTSRCKIEMLRVIEPEGDGDEVKIAQLLEAVADRQARQRPHFVSLSFGGYSSMGMNRLAAAIEQLVDKGVVVVASAGNDGTCLPLYPAALPGVVGVAALDSEDHPAFFTNYGWWVRACTLGVDVVSTFFNGFNGAEVPEPGEPDIDDFSGWAEWSGTSFAAPRVIAALVEFMAANAGSTPGDAVKALIDDPRKMRLPMMGTIVEPSGDHWSAVWMATERRPPP